jgi:hypothetical protein
MHEKPLFLKPVLRVAVFTDPDIYLDSTMCRVVQGQSQNRRERLRKDVPSSTNQDHHGCEDCLSSLADATEWPVLIDQSAYTPCQSALLSSIAKPHDFQIDAAITSLFEGRDIFVRTVLPSLSNLSEMFTYGCLMGWTCST